MLEHISTDALLTNFDEPFTKGNISQKEFSRNQNYCSHLRETGTFNSFSNKVDSSNVVEAMKCSINANEECPKNQEDEVVVNIKSNSLSINNNMEHEGDPTKEVFPANSVLEMNNATESPIKHLNFKKSCTSRKHPLGHQVGLSSGVQNYENSVAMLHNMQMHTSSGSPAYIPNPTGNYSNLRKEVQNHGNASTRLHISKKSYSPVSPISIPDPPDPACTYAGDPLQGTDSAKLPDNQTYKSPISPLTIPDSSGTPVNYYASAESCGHSSVRLPGEKSYIFPINPVNTPGNKYSDSSRFDTGYSERIRFTKYVSDGEEKNGFTPNYTSPNRSRYPLNKSDGHTNHIGYNAHGLTSMFFPSFTNFAQDVCSKDQYSNVKQIQNNAHSSIANNMSNSANLENKVNSSQSCITGDNEKDSFYNFEIEMKAGMFKAVKSDENPSPDILRLKALFIDCNIKEWIYACPSKRKKEINKAKLEAKTDNCEQYNLNCSEILSEVKSHNVQLNDTDSGILSWSANPDYTRSNPDKRDSSDYVIQYSETSKGNKANFTTHKSYLVDDSLIERFLELSLT